MTITITGLLHRAEKRSEGAEGRPVVILTVRGAMDGVDVEFRVHRPSHAEAEILAGTLERGARVEVTASRMRYRSDHGEPTFVLYHVSHATVGGTQL